MKKLVLMSLCCIFGSVIEAADFQETWSTNDHKFDLKKVDYDEQITSDFHNLAAAFISADAEQSGYDKLFGGLENFNKVMRGRIAVHAESHKTGNNSLVLVHMDNLLVAGLYYYTKPDDRIIILHSVGFDHKILQKDSEDLKTCEEKLLGKFSSKSDFSTCDRSIVFLHKDSSYVDRLKQLGFKDSDWSFTKESPQTPSHIASEFLSFEHTTS